MSFAARFRSICSSCDGWIAPGEDVLYTAAGDVVHTDCDECTRSERPTETCTKCWIIKPCECDS